MKSNRYQKRSYRDWVHAQDLCNLQVAVQETDLHILTDRPVEKAYVQERIRFYRRQIESYIQKDRRFLESLKPIAIELQAPRIVRAMGEAAEKANVGPLAAVAGAIAEFLGTDIVRSGCKEVIIENGGDIFLHTQHERIVGLYAGTSKLSGNLYLKVPPQPKGRGICTSSGTVGHSLSFGLADSVVIIARNTILADAVATATANLVRTKQDCNKAIHFARSLADVYGALIIIQNTLASWGEIEFA